MIIFTKNNFIFCILNNPKCGSQTIKKYIYPQIEEKYKVIFNNGNKSIEKTGYSDCNYIHCNLEGAIKYLMKLKIKKCIFITSIRNPIDKIISCYFYELAKREKTHWKYEDRILDIEEFMKWDHLHHFYPEKFRFYKKIKVHELIRMEYLKKDFDKINKKYSLNINTVNLIEKYNENSKKEPIILPQYLKEEIYKKYKKDFIDGKYVI